MKEVLLIKRIKKDEVFNLRYDPTCFDHNIHIRLKKYSGNELVAGLEQKLIFVVEYFLIKFIKSFPSYSVDFNMKDESDATRKYIFSKYINEFKQSEVFNAIKNDLNVVVDFDDIVIKPLYSKKETFTKESQFGNILDVVDLDISSLDEFVSKVTQSASIKAFLLDDSVSLLLSEVEDNLNEKYINKNARKLSKEILKDNGYQENKLW